MSAASGDATVLADRDFRFLADAVYERARIVINPHKRPMVQGRLQKRVKALGLSSVRDYVALLSRPEGEEEWLEMVNAITTNVTGFFREIHHFRHLANTVLPELLGGADPARRLRIWSAGCSSGQEPYSIAMTLHNALRGRATLDARILATDIDTHVLEHARAGCYSQEQVAAVPDRLRTLYLHPSEGDRVVVDQTIAGLVSFKPLNLMQDWPMRGRFDVIFCRNVVIYFDKPTQARLFSRFADALTPGGWLYIGHSESLFNVTDRFELLDKTTYRKVA